MGKVGHYGVEVPRVKFEDSEGVLDQVLVFLIL